MQKQTHYSNIDDNVKKKIPGDSDTKTREFLLIRHTVLSWQTLEVGAF